MNSKPGQGQVCNRDGNCTYKGCKYLHLAQEALPKDPCKYGEKCVKEDCKFGHPDSRRTPGNRPQYGGPRPPMGRKQCRYGPNCTRKDTCGYLHDGPAEDDGFAPPPGVQMQSRPRPYNPEEAKAGTMTQFARDDEERKSGKRPCFKGNECQNPECGYAHDPNVGPSRPPKKPCFKGRQCNNPECPYSHDTEAPPRQDRGDRGERGPRKQNPCFKGAACNKPDCPYSHDPNAAPVQVRKACRSGPTCNKPGCPYNHDPNAAEEEARSAGVKKGGGDVLIRRADPSKPSQDNNAEKYNCIVCTTEAKTTMMLPCKHMSFCDKCTKTYDQSKGCPMCRQPISGVEKIFI